ncbi:hypothetical protein RA27_22105 [Ruegeria sp. ANG-R]|nr:hypothetical protein RA27_22105 [Ruegeria sp. ANG-R]
MVIWCGLIGAITIFAVTRLSISGPPYSAPARERITLQEGEFEAVVRHSGARLSLVPTFPGQSGDRPGTLTIYRLEDKQSCGSTHLSMVGVFTLDGDDETNFITLGRPRKALWDLNDCSIRFHNLYPELR